MADFIHAGIRIWSQVPEVVYISPYRPWNHPCAGMWQEFHSVLEVFYTDMKYRILAESTE